MDLSYEMHESQGAVVLDLKGRLVMGDECNFLRGEILKMMGEKHTRFVFNLANVNRVDSTGIGLLVEVLVLTAKAGGALKLVKVPRLLHNSLVLHRLLPAFEVFDDDEKALASFNQAA